MTLENPFRTDFPGAGPFVGRQVELERLHRALLRGRRSIAAVMGGRGMGKTCLALELERRLRNSGLEAVRLIRTPERNPLKFFAQLGKALDRRLDPTTPTDSIVEAVQRGGRQVALLIDEVEHLFSNPGGLALLDNLRIAWEQLNGQLGVVVFGGSALRKLLIADASPFLRSAQWIPLRGLDRPATAELVVEHSGLERSSPSASDSDETPVAAAPWIDTLWEATCGHPLLLQAILEECLERMLETPDAEEAPPSLEALARRLPESLDAVRRERLETTLFPLWWDNLTLLGQEIYRRLLREPTPLPEARWAERLGPDPLPWVEVLETTGVARVEDRELLARGELFRHWFQQRYRPPASTTPRVEPPTRSVVVDSGPSSPIPAFETRVVDAIERWIRDAHELPTFALKSGKAAGNDRLLPEHHFQLGLAMALRQHPLLVEAEALSSVRGRVDLKIRCAETPDTRTCVELKIWGRNDFADTIGQLLGYTLPTDTFGSIVMVDRQAAPLDQRYHARVLDGGRRGRLLDPGDGAQGQRPYLAFLTEHERTGGEPFRLYHFLIQLPV